MTARLRRWGLRMALLLLVGLALLGVSGYLLLGHRAPLRSVDSAGVTLAYSDQGQGSPVILLHGFAVNGDLNFRLPGVIGKLRAAGHRVIVPDLRGHGRSGKPHEPAAYGTELAEDVVRLMDRLGFSQAHVAGYSLGGFVALKLATLHPERLRSLAVMGAGWADPQDGSFLAALPKLADALEAGQGVPPVAAAFGGPHRKPTLLHRLQVRVLTRWFNDGAALAALLRAGPRLSVSEAELRALPLPVLSIIGDRDLMLPAMERMRGKLRQHTVVLVPGDHLRAVSRPELVQALIALYRQVDSALPPNRPSADSPQP